jgi:hypothetical protein
MVVIIVLVAVLITVLFVYCIMLIGKSYLHEREIKRTTKLHNDKYNEVFNYIISTESKNMYVKSVMKFIGNEKNKGGFFYGIGLADKLDACLSIVNETPYIIDIESDTFATLIDHNPKLIQNALSDNLMEFESQIDSSIADYYNEFFIDKYEDRYGDLDSFDDKVDKSVDSKLAVWEKKSITSKLNFIIKNSCDMYTPLSYDIEGCIKGPITVEYIQLIIKGLNVNLSKNDSTDLIADSLNIA